MNFKEILKIILCQTQIFELLSDKHYNDIEQFFDKNDFKYWFIQYKDTEELLKERLTTFINGTTLPLAIKDINTNKIVGIMSLSEYSIAHKRAEITHVLIGKPYRGMGYCKIATRELINILFGSVGLNKVTWGADSRNIESIKLAEKLGFKLEGLFKKHIIMHDGYNQDIVYLGITNEDHYH